MLFTKTDSGQTYGTILNRKTPFLLQVVFSKLAPSKLRQVGFPSLCPREPVLANDFQETIVLAHNKKSALSKRWRVLFSAPITHALAMETAAGSA